MAANRSWQRRRQRDAWSFGRGQRDRLLAEYQKAYGLAVPPPPAKIIAELLTDFLDATLRFDPLPSDRFAETRFDNGRFVVTVNTEDIEGVKDPEGVQNVGMWHEAIHVIDHAAILRQSSGRQFPGFEVPPQFVCLRSNDPRRRHGTPDDEVEREYWVEEAGRAAAVSLEALQRTESFRALLRAAGRSTGAVTGAWPMLYEAAAETGVNITALVKQLSLEGLIVVDRDENGRSIVHVQPLLIGGVA